MNPIVKALAKELSDSVAFVEVDIEKFASLSDKYTVKSLPTLIFFLKGEEKGRLIGGVSKAELKAEIQKYRAS